MKTISFLISVIILLFVQCSSENKQIDMKAETDSVINEFVNKVKPIYKEMSLAYWNASITGKDEDYKKLLQVELAVNKVLADTELFARVKKIRQYGNLIDVLQIRQIEKIYAEMLPKQVDTNLSKQISELQNKIEKNFSTFRSEIDGKKYTDNEIEEILGKCTDNKKLEKAWIAVKELGSIVAEDIIKLAKLRNQVAQSVGYKNYHEMKLLLDEQNPDEIENIFSELDKLTSEVYTKLKYEIDEELSVRYKIKKEELMPWHYQNRFFQQAPAIYNIDLDSYYKEQNIEKLTVDFFASIGMDVSDIIQRCDLYEKEGKNQHAYCIDIDNEGDVRILCNIRPNNQWMGTMLHEFGHAVYDKYIDMNVHYLLREPAHTFTTEAIAMIKGRLSTNGEWMKSMNIIDENEAKKVNEEGFKMLRLEQLVFSRWSQVMYRFEKALYENPGQDLNKLWWDLVEKYQMMKRPKDRNMPDWATKIHIASSPCYYHNYLLGELLASQLNAYIVKNILKSDNYKTPNYTGNKEIGQFFIEKVFKPGRMYHWNDMIEKATSEKLTPKYYAAQFIE